MTRLCVVRCLVLTSIGMIAGCGNTPEEAATQSSALTTALSAVRGYTRADGQHAIVYGDQTVRGHTGKPPGPATVLSGNIAAGSSPWGYTRANDPWHLDAVIYVDPNREVHELTAFGDANLGTVLGAPPVSPGSPNIPDVIPYVRSDGRNALVYASDTGHIIEILSDFPNSPGWVVNDLTSMFQVPVVNQFGSPFPYVRSDNRNVIVYISNDRSHIHQLSNISGSSSWTDADLTAVSLDTSTPASPLWGYKRSDNLNTVIYIDTLGQMREIALTGGYPCGTDSWCAATITQAVNPTGAFRPSGYVRGDGLTTIVYVSNSSSIREIALLGSGWSDAPLPMPPNVIPVSEAFGHRPPVDDGSVLFNAKNLTTGETNACEIRLPTTSSWIASILGNDVCGGSQHTGCSAAGAFCELATGACATIQPSGACLVKSTVCNETIFPVCGCDGKTYSNDCERQAAGVPKWVDGYCSTSSSCPPTEPVSLASCAPENMSCTYASRTQGCADRLTCSSGVWSAPVTVCGF